MNKYRISTVDGRNYIFFAPESLEELGTKWDDKKNYLIAHLTGYSDNGDMRMKKLLISFKHIVAIGEY